MAEPTIVTMPSGSFVVPVPENEDAVRVRMKTLTVYPSKANYFYGRCTKKEELLQAFADAGIQIRSYADEGFRITVGTEEENGLVLSVLKTYRRNA